MYELLKHICAMTGTLFKVYAVFTHTAYRRADATHCRLSPEDGYTKHKTVGGIHVPRIVKTAAVPVNFITFNSGESEAACGVKCAEEFLQN